MRYAAVLLGLVPAGLFADPLDVVFTNPPPAARPGVMWMWMGCNISKAAITRDLEALHDAVGASDREKRRLVHFDLEGNWIGVFASNLRRPCSVSFFGDNLAVAELEFRVTIIDKTGTPISFLGDNPNQAQWPSFGVPPQDQKIGIFNAPHGLSFDKAGNLYVQDWNKTGRITKLTKL